MLTVCTPLKIAKVLEPHFSRVVMVHQSLGSAAMDYVQKNCPDADHRLIEQMTDVLRLFLPKTSERDLQKGITKIAKKAMALKQNMLEEQALYDCYWIRGGQNFDGEKMDLVGPEGGGPLALCTFPGMARIVLEQNTRRIVHVVKASVLMEV